MNDEVNTTTENPNGQAMSPEPAPPDPYSELLRQHERIRAAVLEAILPNDGSNLLRHATFELERIGQLGEAGSYGGMVGRSVLELVRVLQSQGHSGGSVAEVLELFDRLARFDVLSPITGHPSEWFENDLAMLGPGAPRQWQSTRKPSVFWREGDEAWYDLDDPRKAAR